MAQNPKEPTKSSVFARAQVLIEVKLSQPWNGSETMENIRRIACRDVAAAAARLCAEASQIGQSFRPVDMEPTVEITIVPERER